MARPIVRGYIPQADAFLKAKYTGLSSTRALIHGNAISEVN
jgi:hypothetical protein